MIFDCDGVLVDSEPISLAILTAGLNRIGARIKIEQVRTLYTGMSMASIMADIVRLHAIAVPEDFVSTVKTETLAAFDAELRPMPGIANLLRDLAIPICVASSSDPVRLRHCLMLTGLMPFFERRIFSASEVPRGKPFPDLFLHAAAHMGVDPRNCLVIEDSVPGVLAAGAAGMRVAGFTGGSHWKHDPAGSALLAAGAARIHVAFGDGGALIGET